MTSSFEINADSTTTPADARVHVVMVVGNDVTVDQRVKKIALTVARAGPRVTVIGLSATGEPWETRLGPVRIVRVPVKFTQRDWARAGVSTRSAMSPALAAKRRYVAVRTRRKLAQREIQASIGRLKDDPSLWKRGRAEWLRWKNRLIGKRYRFGELFHLRRLETIRSGRETLPQRVAGMIPGFGSTQWRKALPELHDYELAFGPVIDDLEPDLIHAHDVHMIGIAERAVARARLQGRSLAWIYDAHEYVQGLARYSRRIVTAWANLEKEYIHRADRVITVSAPLAALLVKDYHLSRPPDLVLNIPIVRDDQHDAFTIRQVIGLPEDVPLVVYSGGIDATRGVHTLVEAMGNVPGVHLGLVAKARTNYILSLLETAADGGYDDRIHLVGFVDPDKVVPFLSGATMAVHPMVSNKMNHQIALPNKLFEYLNARLPIVVSDNKAMADLITEHGVGAVFGAEDPDDLAAAIKSTIENHDLHVQAIDNSGVLEKYTWQAQADALLDVYADVLGAEFVERPAAPITSLKEAEADSTVVAQQRSGTGTASLLIGPRNSAGQAKTWADTLSRTGTSATSMAIARPGAVAFPADILVQPDEFRRLDWQLAQAKRVAAGFTHVLAEGGTSVLGRLNGGSAIDDIAFLAEQGINLGVVLHGSEIRRPSSHRELLPYSPFHIEDETTARLEHATHKLTEQLATFQGRVFVTTPDLLRYVPGAAWLPVVVDTQLWYPKEPDPRGGKLVVAHIPSSERLKGTEFVDTACRRLQEEGVIEYVRISGIPPHEVPGYIRSADVVIDGIVLGAYGVMSVQAMASGVVAVADVSLIGDLDAPIVSAQPESLRQVILDLARDRTRLRELQVAGVEFIRRYHDGEYSAQRLYEFLDAT